MTTPLGTPSATNRRAMVIATNFPPDASVGTMRTLRLVRYLASNGWDVDVVTMAPERYRRGTVVDPALLRKVPDAVNVLRPRAWRPIERTVASLRPSATSSSPGSGGGPASSGERAEAPAVSWRARAVGAARACATLPDREVSWTIPAISAAWRRARARKPDVIFSSGPPFTAHVVAAAVARLTGRPWMAEFRDPWARAPWRDDRFTFEKRSWSALERRIVSRASSVLFVTETNRRDFAQHYGAPLATRFHVVPNGCDLTDFDGLVSRTGAKAKPFVLLHAGSLYGARNPAPLFRALERAIRNGLIDRQDFRLRFIGRVGVPGLPAIVRELSLEDVVEFVSHVPRQTVLQEMLDASALLIVQPITTVSVPAKLYEYMAAGRPVLALAEPGGETAAVVEKSGAGLAVHANDEDAILRGLLGLIGQATSWVRVAPDAYDGNRRASEVARLLHSIVPDGVVSTHTRSATVSHPIGTEGTRS